MLCVVQFLIIGAALVVQNHASPWERNNNIREFDLEWQCQQFCDRLKGTLTFNNSDSECTCTIATKGKLDFNSKHLEHKLSDLGFNFKIIDDRNSNKVKRDTPAERIKKLLAERKQKEAPADHNNEVGASGSNPETEPEERKDEKVSDILHRLRSKLLIPKNEKEKEIITAPDNFVLGKPAPEEPKVIEDKTEQTKLKLIGHKNDVPSVTKDNTIVGQAPEEDPPKPTEAPPSRLEALRLRLAALRNANHLPEAVQKAPETTQTTPEEHTKPILGSRHISPLLLRSRLQPLGSKQDEVPQTEKPVDKRQELRERIRMRLQKIRSKNLPNEDGHVEETQKA